MTGQLLIERHAPAIETKTCREAPVPERRKAAPPRTDKARWRRRKDARPQEILEAALQVFAEKGFAAARMDDIAQRARVSKGTIYLYFESKEAVFRALIQETLAKRVADLAALVRDHRDRSPRCCASCCCGSGISSRPAISSMLPKMVIAEAGNFPDLARIYREEVVERGLALFGGLLQTGMERGEFRKVPVQHAVRLCMAPLLLAAIWRTTFAPLDREPYDYAGLIEAHVDDAASRIAARGARGMRRMSRDRLAHACCSRRCAPEENTRWLGYVEGEAVLVAPPQPGWITTLNVHARRAGESKAIRCSRSMRSARPPRATMRRPQIAAAREQGEQAMAQLAQAQGRAGADRSRHRTRARRSSRANRSWCASAASPRRDLETAQAAYDSARRTPQPGAGAARPSHGGAAPGRRAGEASHCEP